MCGRLRALISGSPGCQVRRFKSTLYLICLLSFASAQLLASSETFWPDFPFVFKIEKEIIPGGPDSIRGKHVYLDITKVRGDKIMLAFDLLVGHDGDVLRSMGAIPGELFAIPGDYEWEYFTYRFGAYGGCDSGCPSGLIRIVGIADQNDGPRHPKLNGPVPDDMVLFTLDFQVTGSSGLECGFLPVSFFWIDCGDNSLAVNMSAMDPYEVKQAISVQVYGIDSDSDGFLIEMPEDSAEQVFPNYYGAIDVCKNKYPQNPNRNPVRYIVYYNGGIDIACPEPPLLIGDINDNGAIYEIADAVLFTNYFLYGGAALVSDSLRQTAAADVNRDGTPWTVADLVYLIRVVVGDALPYPKTYPREEPAIFDFDSTLITVNTELGAAYFVFEGNIPVSLGPDALHMSIKSCFNGQQTRAIVYSLAKGDTFHGKVLHATSKPISVEAAAYDAQPFNTEFLPTEFAFKNYPNPFRVLTRVDFTLPGERQVNIEIFDILGRKVRSLAQSDMPRGNYSVSWDGRDDFGARLPSGVYLYRFRAGEYTRTQKMVLLR